MGTWEQVLTERDRKQYNQFLAESNEAYKSANAEGLNRLLDERGGRAFMYSESDPAEFRILLLLTPTNGDPDTWKIVNAVPTGDYDPVVAVKLTWRQIRHVIDEVGVTSFYGTPLRDYGDPKMNEYFRLVPELFWELHTEEDATNGKFRYTFKRLAERRSEDERFLGPRSQGDKAREISL